MTNGDLLRSLNDNQLARLLCWIQGDVCDNCEECIASQYCSVKHNGLQDWIKQEDDPIFDIYREEQKENTTETGNDREE